MQDSKPYASTMQLASVTWDCCPMLKVRSSGKIILTASAGFSKLCNTQSTQVHMGWSEIQAYTRTGSLASRAQDLHPSIVEYTQKEISLHSFQQ